MSRKKRFWLGTTVVAIGLVVWWWYAFHAGGGKPIYTVGKETTYVTGPVDRYGHIDYTTALNQKISNGITPQENAFVLIVEAIGPRPEGGTMAPEFYQWVKMSPPPELQKYYLSFEKVLKGEGKLLNLEDQEPFLDQMAEATHHPWSATNHPELSKWIQENEKPLAKIYQATMRTKYFMPLVSQAPVGRRASLLGVLMPHVQVCRGIAAALTARAMLRTEQKRYNEAWQDLLTCHRLGRILSNGATLIELLVAIAIDGIARQADLAYLQHANLTPEQIKDCLNDLQSLPPFVSGAEKIDLGERFMALDAIMQMDREGAESLEHGGGSDEISPMTGKVNWDPALKMLNQWYDRLIAAYREEDLSKREAMFTAMDKETARLRAKAADSSFLKGLFTTRRERGKRIGAIVMSLFTSALGRIREAEDRAIQGHRNLLIAFALAAYRSESGHYPKELSALVPKYLNAVPEDLYTGKPLVYRPQANGYLLYSLGPNQIDDNGETRESGTSADDLSIQMPPAEKKNQQPE